MELVIVIVIIGIIAAVALPRMSGASENSRLAALKSSLRAMTVAVEMYAAEHGDRTPAHDTDGSVNSDPAVFERRLVQTSDMHGNLNGVFGPYLRALPENPYNHKTSVRIDGAAAGAGTDGWRFDSARREFQADDSVLTAVIKPGAGSMQDADAQAIQAVGP